MKNNVVAQGHRVIVVGDINTSHRSRKTYVHLLFVMHFVASEILSIGDLKLLPRKQKEVSLYLYIYFSPVFSRFKLQCKE